MAHQLFPWLLAILNDTDAVPYLERYVRRDDLLDVDRTQGEIYLLYFSEGLEGVLDRIRNHVDHARMPFLGRLVFAIGTSDVDPALEQLLATAPDERCRVVVQQTLEALKTARTERPPPQWNRDFSYENLPRLK